MILVLAALLVIVATVAIVASVRTMPNGKTLASAMQRITDGSYSEVEHLAMLRGAVRDQTSGVVAHLAMAGVQICFLLAWHEWWWLVVVYLATLVMQILLVRKCLGRRRYFQQRVQEVEDQVVAEARVDEEAERLLRRNDG